MGHFGFHRSPPAASGRGGDAPLSLFSLKSGEPGVSILEFRVQLQTVDIVNPDGICELKPSLAHHGCDHARRRSFMIELYHNDRAVCAQKVRFALAEKKLQWENHHLNLRAGDQQKAEYLKLNPNAVVPTLVDNGTVIIESTVICEYLDDAYPEPTLRPTDAVARARMRLWTKQLDEGVHAATSVISSAI